MLLRVTMLDSLFERKDFMLNLWIRSKQFIYAMNVVICWQDALRIIRNHYT